MAGAGPTSITFIYQDPVSLVETEMTIDQAFQYGNRDLPVSGQQRRRNRGGRPYVYETGTAYRKFEWSFAGLRYDNRKIIEDFFVLVSTSCKWFSVRFKPTSMEPVRLGATILNPDDVGESAGFVLGSYTLGERVLMTEITHRVRLMEDLVWDEGDDGRFDLSMSLDVLGEFAPSNGE